MRKGDAVASSRRVCEISQSHQGSSIHQTPHRHG